MKKIILAMVLVFSLSSASFAAGPVWGVGVTNVLTNLMTFMMGGSSGIASLDMMPAGTLFYNFNDQNSIEGDIGVLQASMEDGAKMNLTVLGLRYLFNFYTSARFNSHIGIEGTTASGRGSGSVIYNDIGLLFGGEIFITDKFSILADLTAHSYTMDSDPTDSDDYNTTAINIWPMLSFRLYM